MQALPQHQRADVLLPQGALVIGALRHFYQDFVVRRRDCCPVPVTPVDKLLPDLSEAESVFQPS